MDDRDQQLRALLDVPPAPLPADPPRPQPTAFEFLKDYLEEDGIAQNGPVERALDEIAAQLAETAELRQRVANQASVIETERRAHVWKVNDLETTVQNEHKLYADAWAKYEAAKAELDALKAKDNSARGRLSDPEAFEEQAEALLDSLTVATKTEQAAAGSPPRCSFDKAWIGPCGAPAVDRGMCAEHAPLVCIGCGAPATLSCDYDTAFVCGYPLCANCEHDPPSENHPFGRGHVSKVKR